MTKRFVLVLAAGLVAGGCGDGAGPSGNGGHGGFAGGHPSGGVTGSAGHGGGGQGGSPASGGAAGGAAGMNAGGRGGSAGAIGSSGGQGGGAGGAFGGVPGGGGAAGSGGVVATGGANGGAGGVATGGAAASGGTAGAAGGRAGMTGGGGSAGAAAGTAGTAGTAGAGGTTPPSSGELSVCSVFRARTGGRSGTLSLDLGHTSSISVVRVAGDRVVTQDGSGRWMLWDTTTGNAVLAADAATSVDLAGAVLAVTTSATSADVRAASDGHALSSLTLPTGPLHVGPAGAYVWSAGTTALRAWTPAGSMVVDVAGDYSTAKIAAVADELRVALGPAGAGVIERITVGTSARATTPFSASFAAWFDDGERFITHTGDTVFVDALDGSQLQIISFPTGAWMTAGGWGNYFWTAPGSGTIYAVGSSTAITPTLVADSAADVAGHLVYSVSSSVLLAFTASSVSRVNWSGPATPTQIGVSPEGHWAFGTSDGRVYDSRSALPRHSLSCGTLLSIDGAPTGDTAIGVASNQVVVTQLGPSGPATTSYRLDVIGGAGNVELTFDGQELATSSINSLYMSGGFQQLHLLALPAGTPIISFGAPNGFGFSRLRVAGGGGLISYIVDQAGLRMGTYVIDPLGGAIVYRTSSTNGDNPEMPLLAPGGQLFAMAGALSPATRIYKRDGTLVNAVNGQGLVWMDDNRLLVFETVANPASHHELHLYDGNGVSLAAGVTTTSQSMGNVKAVGADGVYATDDNSIYSVSTGAKTWTGSFPAALGGFTRDDDPRRGSVSGGYIVYPSGHEVIAEPY